MKKSGIQNEHGGAATAHESSSELSPPVNDSLVAMHVIRHVLPESYGPHKRQVQNVTPVFFPPQFPLLKRWLHSFFFLFKSTSAYYFAMS